MFCFPEGIQLTKEVINPICFSFILTDANGDRSYCTCLQFSEEATNDTLNILGYHLGKQEPIFTQKAIVIGSAFPFLDEYKVILKNLYRISLSKQEIPLQDVIKHMVDDVKLPEYKDRGTCGVQYQIGVDTILFADSLQYPHVSSFSLELLFRCFKAEKIVFLVKCLLLEQKICLRSKSKFLLTCIAEALMALIFPFKWTHVLIPILPDNLRAYIETPVPFIIGMTKDISGISLNASNEVYYYIIILTYLIKLLCIANLSLFGRRRHYPHSFPAFFRREQLQAITVQIAALRANEPMQQRDN